MIGRRPIELVQSVAGQGKSFKSGDITLDINADVRATGQGGRAILVQSQSQNCCTYNGKIAIDIAAGATVSGGNGQSETIAIFDGQ